MSGTTIRTWIADLFLLLSFAGSFYLLLAAALSWRFGRRPGPAPVTPVPVSILKPLHGDEPGLADRLATFVQQNYAGRVQYLFGVADFRDAAIPAVEALRQRFPDADIELVIDARRHGTNKKVSNLINMAERSRFDVVIAADSDIEVGPDYLTRIVAELMQPGVGAVTCLYYGVAGGGMRNQLAALQIDSHFLPNAITGTTIGLAHPCFGSTIALRRETLEAIGGFARVANALADDNEVGEAVRATGLAVKIPALVVGHGCDEPGLGAFLRHELRWARTIKSVDPVGYAGTLVTYPLPLALLAGILGGALWPVAVVVAVAARIGLLWSVGRSFGLRRQPYWLTPVRDLLSFGLYIASFFGGSVRWRGEDYRVSADGTLVEDRQAPLK